MTESAVTPTADEALPVVRPASKETEVVIFTRASSLHEEVEALVIEDEAGLEKAAGLMTGIDALRKEVDTDLGEPARVARKLWEMIRERFTKHDNPLKADYDVVKGKIKAYHQEAERLRKKQIEAAGAQARAREEEDDARLAEAERLEKAGDHEAAEAVLAEQPTVAPLLDTSAPKTKGITVRENWKAEILDMMKVAEAAVGGDPVARSILVDVKVKKAAEAVASKVAKGMKANMSVPGIRAYDDPVVGKGKL